MILIFFFLFFLSKVKAHMYEYTGLVLSLSLCNCLCCKYFLVIVYHYNIKIHIRMYKNVLSLLDCNYRAKHLLLLEFSSYYQLGFVNNSLQSRDTIVSDDNFDVIYAGNEVLLSAQLLFCRTNEYSIYQILTNVYTNSFYLLIIENFNNQ